MTASIDKPLRPDIEEALANDRFFDDPYPVFTQLREQAPCYWNEAGRQWLLTRYADVERAFHSPHIYSSTGWHRSFFDNLNLELRGRVARLERRGTTPFLVTLDRPGHAVLRKALQPAFTPASIESMRPFIEALVAELLDESLARDGTEIDLVEALAYPLPAVAIASILGVPAADRYVFQEASRALSTFMGHPDLNNDMSADQATELETKYAEFEDYLIGLLLERRRNPRDGDLLSTLLDTSAEEGISEFEIVINLVLFLSAGHETTTAAIGNAVYSLLTHREQYELLCNDSSLLNAAFEETVRWQSPVQVSRRMVAEETELHGQRLRVGDRVELRVGAANRDPARFEDADRFDITRPRTPNLAFGKGTHFCIGAGLARLETTVALQELTGRFPRLAISKDWSPSWYATTLSRSLTTLKLGLGA